MKKTSTTNILAKIFKKAPVKKTKKKIPLRLLRNNRIIKLKNLLKKKLKQLKIKKILQKK